MLSYKHESTMIRMTMKNNHNNRCSALLVCIILLQFSFSCFGFIFPAERCTIFKPTKSACNRYPRTKGNSCLSMNDGLATLERVADIPKTRSMVGRIPWNKFVVGREQAIAILKQVKAESRVGEIVSILFFGLFSTSLFRFLHSKFRTKDYEGSITCQIANNLRQGARLLGFFYALDVFEIGLEVLGLDKTNVNFSKIASRIVFAYWFFLRIRVYKSKYLEKTITFAGGENVKRGKLVVWDKILDGFLSFILFLFWLDVLHVPMGRGLSSIFALGGAGTLIITLACQDLAQKIMSGLALSTSEYFFEGDEIVLGDGTTGFVSKIGWLSTEVRGYDEKITIIPNTEIFNQRVSNLSRMDRCQVKQTLRFSYDDIQKIPKLVQDIKHEIQTSCPKLITEDRPFRSHWREYEEDHIKVVVDCHFEIKRMDNQYWDNRQRVLEAIHRAMKKNEVKFAIPISVSIEKSE